MAPEFRPGDLMIPEPGRMRVHVWVNKGVPTLTIITGAPEGFSIDWPEHNGSLLVFDAATEVTVTEVQP